MVSTDYKENGKQRWPVVLNFADNQKGPFMGAPHSAHDGGRGGRHLHGLLHWGYNR